MFYMLLFCCGGDNIMFGDKLNNLRKRNGYSMDKLAELYNEKFGGKLNKSTISRYENNLQEPIFTTVKNFAELFNVTTDYLTGTDISLPDGAIPYNPIMHRIPILGDIAAGLPIFAEENIDGYTYTELNHGGEYFALRVKGDSMTAANIPDGSLVTVRVQPQVENGEIAAVRVNDSSFTVKRFKQDKNIIMLMPQSYNPEHQVQIYDLKKDKIDVVGKVMECKVEF